MNPGLLFLQAARAEFKRYKDLCDRALAQVSEAEWFYLPAAESNSLAHLVKHLGGNLRSRWSDFLTSDGEKPDRLRDQEFELYESDSIKQLLEGWELGWSLVLDTLAELSDTDLTRSITIRSQPHTVPDAIQRSLAHVAYHSGQIVQLVKLIRGSDFQTLTVPKGESERFLLQMQEKYQNDKS